VTGAKFLMIQDFIKKILAMLLFIFLARTLTMTDFGHYQQIFLLISIFVMLFSGGIPNSFSYFYGKKKSNENNVNVLFRFLTIQLVWVVFGCVLIILINDEISEYFDNPYMSKYIFIIAIIFFCNVMLEFYRVASVIYKRLKLYTLITSSVQIISVILSVIYIYLYNDFIFLLYIIAFFSTIQILTLFFIQHYEIRNEYNISHQFMELIPSKTELYYIISLSSVALVSVLNGLVDQIMVSFLLTPTDFAIIKVGAFQIPFIGVITGTFLTLMIPLISKYKLENKLCCIEELWNLSISKSSVLLIPIIVFCLIFSFEIITSFFGEEYFDSVIVFQVYMLQWLRSVVIFGGVMAGIGLEKELFKNTLIMAILNVFLNYFMIIEFGVLGAALSTTVLSYFGAFLLIRKIDTVLPHKFMSYFPFAIYFKVFSLSILLALFFKLLLTSIGNDIIIICSVSIIYYLLYLTLWLKINDSKISIHSLKSLL
jgi:O-antigen/teichoic acid export membrane protein